MNRAIELFHQYKSKLVWTFGLSAGIYAFSQILKSKLLSLQSELLQAQSGQANFIRRFEQTQQDSTFTVLTFISQISLSIFKEFDPDVIEHTLKKKDSDSPNTTHGASSSAPVTLSLGQMNKRQLWQEYKIVSITRLFVSAYAMTLLTLFTRLQLNIIGRYSYLDSILYDNPNPAPLIPELKSDQMRCVCTLPSHIEQMYLTFFWYFLQDGWKMFAERVRNAVIATYGSVSIKSEISPELLAQWLNQVRSNVESDMDQNLKSSFLCKILMPPEDKEYEVLQNGGIAVEGVGKVMDPLLRMVLDETRDFLESPHFYYTFIDCSSSIFNLVLAHLGVCFQKEGTTNFPAFLAVAKLLPETILTSSPNDFNMVLAENKTLRNFSTLVYTIYSNVCGC